MDIVFLVAPGIPNVRGLGRGLGRGDDIADLRRGSGSGSPPTTQPLLPGTPDRPLLPPQPSDELVERVQRERQDLGQLSNRQRGKKGAVTVATGPGGATSVGRSGDELTQPVHDGMGRSLEEALGLPPDKRPKNDRSPTNCGEFKAFNALCHNGTPAGPGDESVTFHGQSGEIMTPCEYCQITKPDGVVNWSEWPWNHASAIRRHLGLSQKKGHR